MAENRYNGILKRWNSDIVLITANDPLKVYVAHELRNALSTKKQNYVLEIGCGEGELTKHILMYTKNTLVDALDPSSSMLRACKKHMAKYRDRLRYLQGDIVEYNFAHSYDAIVASQVIHNFNQEDKIRAFQRIYDLLTPGGTFIMTDKVYPDDPTMWDALLEVQCRRYRDYLPAKAAEAIITHEQQDISDTYRMEETPVLTQLTITGFTYPHVIERIERDVVIKANKHDSHEARKSLGTKNLHN